MDLEALRYKLGFILVTSFLKSLPVVFKVVFFFFAVVVFYLNYSMYSFLIMQNRSIEAIHLASVICLNLFSIAFLVVLVLLLNKMAKTLRELWEEGVIRTIQGLPENQGLED